MDRIINVYKGAEIPTPAGVLNITYINTANLIYGNEYCINEEGGLDFLTERRMTAEEIENEVKMIDGKNHKVNFLEV